jgi:hypothetical protein
MADAKALKEAFVFGLSGTTWTEVACLAGCTFVSAAAGVAQGLHAGGLRTSTQVYQWHITSHLTISSTCVHAAPVHAWMFPHVACCMIESRTRAVEALVLPRLGRFAAPPRCAPVVLPAALLAHRPLRCSVMACTARPAHGWAVF